MSGIKDLHRGRGGRCPGRPVVVLEPGTPDDVEALVKEAKSTLDEAVRLNNEALAKIGKLQEGADGKSAYELYLERGGYLSLDEWLASLHGQDADVEAAEAATAAANDAADAAETAAEAAIAAEATRQETFDTNEEARGTAYSTAENGRNTEYQTAENGRNTEYQTAENARNAAAAAGEAQRAETFETNESGRGASVTAAQAAAAAAATSAEAANGKFTAIQEAIAQLDPSQSTSDAVAAEAVTRAAADAQMASDIAALGPKMYQTVNSEQFVFALFGKSIDTSTNKVVSRSNYVLQYAPVSEGDPVIIIATNPTVKNISTGFTQVKPSDDVSVTSIDTKYTTSYNRSLNAPLDGFVVIGHHVNDFKNISIQVGNAKSKLCFDIDTSQGVITTGTNMQSCYYLPVSAGNKVHLGAANSTGQTFKYGFTTQEPAEGVQVSMVSEISTKVNVDIEPVPQNGYIVCSKSAYYMLDFSITELCPIAHILSDVKANVDSISFVPIKGNIIELRKINADGSISDAASAANRTFVADVSNYTGKTLYLDGVLYSASNTYCWYSFFDSNGSLVLKSNVSDGISHYYSKEPIVVPSNAATLYVQGSSSTFPGAKVNVNDAIEINYNQINSSIRRFPLYFRQISTSGFLSTFNGYLNKANKHTEFIKVHNSIKVHNLAGVQQSVTIYYYDDNLSLISYKLYSDATNGLTELTIDNIPVNAKWFRLSIALADDAIGTKIEYKEFYLDIESEWEDGNETSKLPYAEYTPFLYPVKVNIPIKIANNPSITTKTVFAYDEGLIHLPPTYTPNGKPTPVIFFIHGDAERYEVGESTFSGHMKMQQCWSDAGFAQVDLDLIPSCYNEPTLASSGGTRDDLECLSAAWEWITNHFNVDKRGFYLIGRSRGGQCVFEVLGKGGASKLPIIAAISMAGANSIFEYSVYSVANEAEWQLWCNAHGLPTSGRPTWGRTDTTKSFLSKTECYNFVVANWDLWWRKGLTGWGLITKNSDNITPRDYFDNYIYPYVQNNRTYTTAIEEFFEQMVDTMEAKSPIPLRLDWCIGDQTQTNEYFVSPHSYSSVFAEILLNTPASLTEYRRWDGVDASNPYNETDPHFAENMIFYNGDLTLPNGAVTSNPSKVAMEWLVWCMGKDPRYQGMDYTLPWQ